VKHLTHQLRHIDRSRSVAQDARVSWAIRVVPAFYLGWSEDIDLVFHRGNGKNCQLPQPSLKCFPIILCISGSYLPPVAPIKMWTICSTVSPVEAFRSRPFS